MTGAEALAELLDRVGASRDGAVFVDELELRGWPAVAVSAMKSAGLLAAAADAASVICPGCERQCTMPVYVLPADGAAIDAFVVCDKRTDINRVAIEPDSLKRWQASGEMVAALLARLLGLRRRDSSSAGARRWEVGAFKGQMRSSHLVLRAHGELRLTVAGHVVALRDILRLQRNRFVVTKGILTDCVDHPAAGGGDRESAEQRRARLARRVNELKRLGHRKFLQLVAAEENISAQRLKQILSRGTSGAASVPKSHK